MDPRGTRAGSGPGSACSESPHTGGDDVPRQVLVETSIVAGPDGRTPRNIEKLYKHARAERKGALQKGRPDRNRLDWELGEERLIALEGKSVRDQNTFLLICSPLTSYDTSKLFLRQYLN